MIAIFDEKYGEEVRVVSFGTARRACGGTHAKATGDIGLLKTSRVRHCCRGPAIEARRGLVRFATSASRALATDAAETLKVPLAELPGRVGKLIEERKEAQKQIDELRSKRSSGGAADDLFAQARAIASQDGAKAIMA